MKSRHNKSNQKDYFKKYSATLNGRYKLCMAQAKARGILFSLTFAVFSEVVSAPCIYCGEKDQKIGIDRIDNSIGYTETNSAPCCKRCNFMKKDLSYNDFVSQVGQIYKNLLSIE